MYSKKDSKYFSVIKPNLEKTPEEFSNLLKKIVGEVESTVKSAKAEDIFGYMMTPIVKYTYDKNFSGSFQNFYTYSFFKFIFENQQLVNKFQFEYTEGQKDEGYGDNREKAMRNLTNKYKIYTTKLISENNKYFINFIKEKKPELVDIFSNKDFDDIEEIYEEMYRMYENMENTDSGFSSYAERLDEEYGIHPDTFLEIPKVINNYYLSEIVEKAPNFKE